MSRSYLDALSGQPIHPLAWAAIEGFSSRAWADPHQSHHEGQLSAQILQAARESVALTLDLPPSAISFHPIDELAGLAVGGVVEALATRTGSDPSVIASAIERADVLGAARNTCSAERVTQITVDSTGAIELGEFVEVIANERGAATAIVVQVANTELGTRQPLREVIALAHRSHLPVVTDATGALGLIDIPAGWSVLFANAVTWAGPPGVGVLAIADASAWTMPNHGTDSPTTQPVDTVDVLSAAAAAAALDGVWRQHESLGKQLFELVEVVRARVPEILDDVDMLGDPTHRLPHVVTFSVLYADGERLASELNQRGIAVGSGSACASRAGLPSHVLEAVGALTHGNVRISLPVDTTAASIEHFLEALPAAAEAVRSEAGAP